MSNQNDDLQSNSFTYMNRTLKFNPGYTPQPIYRAAWITANDATVHGEWTDLDDAQHQVDFLKSSRTAWLEDADGNKVDDSGGAS